MMKLGSLFDGSGGFPLAGALCGITPVFASEVEPYPIAVTRSRFPRMKHLGSVTEINGAEIEPVDVITFGSPCFPAGTLILTNRGYLEIEQIRPGMKVLTHKGRWRKVTAAGAKLGKTVIVKGNHYGLECTPNHPIYSAEMRRYYPSVAGKRKNIRLISNEKNWTPAEQMQGKLWAVPHAFEPLPVPRPIPIGDYRLKDMPPFDANFFYLVGRWIGDGWVRDGQRLDRPDGQTFGTIVVCDGYAGEKKLKDAVESVVDNYSVERCRTGVKYKFTSRLLCDWLTTHFGSGAANKKMPAWVYSMPVEWRGALMQGIIDTDGYKNTETAHRITTISKKLAHGIRLLGETLGFSTTVFYTITADTCMIEGRLVNQRDYYTVQLTASKNRGRLSDELHSWYHVRNVYATGEEKTVYNLTVKEDNSYIADDVVVHNCQDLSIAGKRAGIHEGERSNLFFEAIRIIKEMRHATNGKYPAFAIWENVPGAFSSNKGEDFRSVLEEFVSVAGGEAVSIPLPEKSKWRSAGEIVGDGFSVAWRVLDAQYWGVPQRRKRIYLVADFTGKCAGKILFERDGLSGDFESSQATREGIADDASGSAGRSDRVECLNPWDCQSKRQYSVDGVYRTLDAGQASGGQAHGVVYANDVKCLNPWDVQSCRQYAVDGAFPALQAHQGGRYEGVCFALDSMSSNSMKSANPHSGFHEESVTKTLQAGGVDPTCNQGGNVIVEPVAAFMGGQGSKAKGIGYSEDAAPTIKSVMSGGNTVPDVVYALQGNGIDRAETAGCNGKGWRENECYTLNTIDRPAVVYDAPVAVDGYNQTTSDKMGSLRAGKSDGDHVGILVYDARGNGDGETVPTLTGDHQNRVTDYTSVCIMAHGQSNAEITQDMSPTLNCNHEQPIAAYGVDCRNAVLDEEKTHTLQAKASGGQSLNCTPSVLTDGKPPRKYIVRRLTPLECCRLQGFPDEWADIDRKDDFTDEELDFWRNVRNTHAAINGKQTKEYTKAQMLKWYNGLQTDSAIYRMWGNGIALPCAQYVMEGVALALKGEKMDALRL